MKISKTETNEVEFRKKEEIKNKILDANNLHDFESIIGNNHYFLSFFTYVSERSYTEFSTYISYLKQIIQNEYFDSKTPIPATLLYEKLIRILINATFSGLSNKFRK